MSLTSYRAAPSRANPFGVGTPLSRKVQGSLGKKPKNPISSSYSPNRGRVLAQAKPLPAPADRFGFRPFPANRPRPGGAGAKSRMWAFVVVELYPLSDARPGFRAGFPGVQVDAFVFQAPPEPLHEDGVHCPAGVGLQTMRGEEPGFAAHRDARARPPRPVAPGKGRELRSQVGVHDLGRAEPGDGLVQRLDRCPAGCTRHRTGHPAETQAPISRRLRRLGLQVAPPDRELLRKSEG